MSDRPAVCRPDRPHRPHRSPAEGHDRGRLPCETQAILNTYGHRQALQHAHGYPELVDAIEGRRTLSDAIEQIGINIRQYSRRQMTWFRSLPKRAVA
ncbi:MAG: hypothetical protein R2857_13950 [Vampirovibrionales bacterium]